MTSDSSSLTTQFQTALPSVSVAEDYVTGTVTAMGTYPHFERGRKSHFVTLQLDPNPFGIETARAFVAPLVLDLVGRRIRGKLMLDDMAQRDITKHGVTGYNWMHSMMKLAPGAYYDPRTSFLDADDPVLRVTGDVARENLNVFGITHIDKGYYLAHGYNFERPEVETRVNPFKRLMDFLNPFHKPAPSEKPQLEYHR